MDQSTTTDDETPLTCEDLPPPLAMDFSKSLTLIDPDAELLASFRTTPAPQAPCLFCPDECSCPPPPRPGRRRKPATSRWVLRQLGKDAFAAEIEREKRAAVAHFVSEIEGRLFRAETDVTFTLEDFAKIQHALLPVRFPQPPEAFVRIPEEVWERLCDILLTVEREKILANEARGKKRNDKHGPDRYLFHRLFPLDDYYWMLRYALPEMFCRPTPERPASGVWETPGTPGKLELMAQRYQAGEAIFHPDDPSNRGLSEAVGERVALFFETVGGEKRPAFRDDESQSVKPELVGADYRGRQDTQTKVIRLTIDEEELSPEILQGDWQARNAPEQSGGRRGRAHAE